MSEWIVYGKDGQTEKCRLKSVEYSGSFLNERAVSATIENHSKIQFEVFDYIEYRGERFELESIPTVKKTSSFSYEYELRFVSYKYELERCEMRDIVPNDNRVVYPTPLTFSFTGDVRYLVERIQACLDDLYGKGVWNLSVTDDVVSEEKNITIAQQNCWNALALVNTTYGLNFYIKGRSITIGGSQPILNHTFQYGKGNGLYEIERTSDTDTAIVTKLRAYGSERNLDYSYPKKPEWSDSALDTSFVLSPLRLMLPSFKKDGKTDYILADEATIAEYGIREASVIYDDIYPTITGAKNLQGQAIDEIKAVETVDDTKSTFVIHLHDLGFDLKSHLTTADAQISMKSGAMQGYTFNISAIEKQEDNSYKITLGRITTDTSDTGNYEIPNSSWNMAAGDKFVLLNILMPQEYIREAENRLLERAKEYLAEYGKTNFSYNVGLHDKFLVENSDVYSSLVEGAKLTIHDEVLGISEDVTIQSITITENVEDNILPQVKITLNNKPSASTLDRIQGQIKELSETTSGTFSSQSELLKQYRKKLDKPFFDRLFVAVGLDGKELASTDTNSPIAYIKAKYSFATIGGVTMYAQDGSVDIPIIAEGLPFDNRTIWFNPTTGQIEVIGGTGGGTGGGSGEGVSNFWDLSGIPLWITNTKPTYSYSEIKNTPDLSVYALKTSIPSLNGYATQAWVKSQGYLTQHQDLSGYQTKITSSNKLAYSLISGTPTSLKNPYSLTFGSKTYDGSSAKTITASDLGALTNHQTIYTLTFQSGIFASGSFTANSANKTINIPTTTSHISEGSNLYFTNTRAVSALADTLKAYVTLAGTQTITAEKNFVGGLKVNGSPIVYDSRGFWKLEGDLLVTGGVSMYSNDTAFTPSTIMDAIVVDNVTIIKQDGKLVALGGGGTGGGLVDSVAWGNVLGKPSWITDTAPIIGISGVNVSLGSGISQSALRTALGLGSNAYTSTSYLPLSGGTLTNMLTIASSSYAKTLKIANTDYTQASAILFMGNSGDFVIRSTYASDDSISDLRFNKNTLKVNGKTVYHSGNFTPSDYLPLTGGALTGNLSLQYANPRIILKDVEGTTLGVFGLNNDVLSYYKTADTKWYTIYHSGNFTPSNYLPLTGGTLSGKLILDNNIALCGKATDGTAMSVLQTTTNNNLSIGLDIAAKGYSTYISGNYIYLRYGTSRTNGLILNSLGNITIGSSDSASDGYKFYVDGRTYINGAIYTTSSIIKVNSGNDYRLVITHSGEEARIYNYLSDDSGYGNIRIGTKGSNCIFFDGVNSRLGIKTISPGYTLDVNGVINTNNNVYAQTTSNVIRQVKVANDVGSTALYVTTSGNRGLYDLNDNSWIIYTDGTNTISSTKTHIQRSNVIYNNNKMLYWYQSGNATSMSTLYVNASNALVLGKGTAQAGGATYLDGNVIYFRYGKSNTTGMYLNSSGNVGIGTGSPSCKFHVAGDILSTNFLRINTNNSTYDRLRLVASSNGYSYIQASNADGTATQGGSLYVTGINATNLTSFEVMATTSKFHGNILATGGVTMYSARKLKNITDERGLSLEELSVIKPTRFTWKDGRDDKIHIGGIADDVMKVLPEVIYKTEDDTLTMDYGNAAFAIAASLINPVINHEAEIRILKERIKELEEKVKVLTWNIA